MKTTVGYWFKIFVDKFSFVGWRGLLVFMILIAGCQQNSGKREIEIYNKAIEDIKVESQYQWLVVLPGLGCNGCIQEAEAFMKNHIEDERILFVLTKISSLKILQQKTDIRIDEHTNIFVDRKDLFNIPTNNAIYLCVIQLRNGKIFTHSYQKPSNPALWKLEEQLLIMISG